MSLDTPHETHESFFLQTEEQCRAASLAEKRRHLKGIAEEVKCSGQFTLPESIMPAIHVLAEDENWEVRQDVAELLLFAPAEDFMYLAGSLVNDCNMYVRRSAKRAIDRRNDALSAVKRACRGIEQFEQQYEKLARKAGDKAVAEEAIKLADARFSMLANAIIHDLLSLLTPLREQAAALENSIPDGKGKVCERAKQLRDGLDFMKQSIRDAETYARDLPVQRRPEWLHEVIRQAKDLAIQNLKALGLDISSVDIKVDVGEIRVDIARQLIVQAVTNVLKNACESLIDDGQVCSGTITVSAQATIDTVTIAIVDDGRGLTEEELVLLRAFLPGRKYDRKPRSTGYGLLIAKKNIEAHDGTLAVESVLNAGTTVTITLPLKAREAQYGESPDS